MSVTRIHSIIAYRNSEYFLKDNDSKFGTLVILKGEQQIKNFEFFLCKTDKQFLFQ